MRHPIADGIWHVRPRDGVSLPVEVRAHTAFEAAQRSGLRPEYSFNELTFELVQDLAPAVPAVPVRAPRRKKAIGRLVGAERARL